MPAPSTSDSSTFADLFGQPPRAAASAPGRVNLIGEHTDYNDGFVLPTVLPRRTLAEVAPAAEGARQDARRVRAWSAQYGGPLAYRLGEEAPGRGWLDYVQGLTVALAEAGRAIGGFDLRLASDVPAGSGLASSAALEVAVLRALRAAFTLELDDLALAQLGQRAENGFVGAQVGIMDQMAASLGQPGHALFLDTRDLRTERLPLPPADLLVMGSGVAHRNAEGGYNARRAECERARDLLGVPALRDLTPADLPRVERLPAPLDRRARHVVTENARVLAAVAALRAGDAAELGRLFAASHASQRDDYEVSVPEVDLLVDLAHAEGDVVYGARLTGGGFGGSVVVLARPGAGAGVAERMVAAYRARTGREATLLLLPAEAAGESAG